jgi:hypothetical protein
VLAVDHFGQANAPFEAAEATLGISPILVFDLGAFRAAQRQQAVFNGNHDDLLVVSR